MAERECPKCGKFSTPLVHFDRPELMEQSLCVDCWSEFLALLNTPEGLAMSSKPFELTDLTVPTFDHDSHLDPAKWLRVTEKGVEIPGWVYCKNQIKAVRANGTFRTYVVPKLPAPVPTGSSWNNLDLCGGWSRRWHIDQTPVDEDGANLRRVLAGEKLCGSIIARQEDEERTLEYALDLAAVREAVAKKTGFDLVITPFLDTEGQPMQWWTGNPLGGKPIGGKPIKDIVRCWIAPRRTLGEAVNLPEIAEWYDAGGNHRAAQAIRSAKDLYLPDLAERYDAQDADGLESYAITGLILGYPPASTNALNY